MLLAPRQQSYALLGACFGCEKLVLDGIRLLAKQILGSILDIEVDQSAKQSHLDRHLTLIFLITFAIHSLNSVRKELNLD